MVVALQDLTVSDVSGMIAVGIALGKFIATTFGEKFVRTYPRE
jgi:hypothetical protein